MLYRSVNIGSIHLDGNLFLAPIAGYSDMAFRSLCSEFGASLCTTEMVSAEALVRGNRKANLLMRRAHNEKVYAVQIFGGNPDVMAVAAKIVLEKTDCEIIDINGGCPVPKIVKSGAGSCLTRDPNLLYAIVSAVKNSVKEFCAEHPKRRETPVTVKIRSGWESHLMTWRENAEKAVEAGVDAVTIHARTRAQGYSGLADWGIQREFVKAIGGRVPVFGSGDVFTPEKARQMLEETGVDGIMFARGAVGNPFIFRHTKEFLTTGTYEKEDMTERLIVGFRELAANVVECGEKVACQRMRKKFCAYTFGIPNGGTLRSQITSAECIADYHRIFSDYLPAEKLQFKTPHFKPGATNSSDITA